MQVNSALKEFSQELCRDSSFFKKVIAVLLIVILTISQYPKTVHAAFVPSPQTAYALEFINKCDGQVWFLEEVEKQLNIQELSINTINSRDDLNKIFTFGFADKNITGRIPRAIGEFKNLKYLYLGKNNLSGSIPSEMFNLTELIVIDLSENNLSGQLSSSFSVFSKLESLLLWNNRFSGVIPKEIGTLSKLKNLDLSNNSLSGAIPGEITQLTNITLLSLSQNQLTSSIPSNIGNLTNLKVLLLWSNRLSGTIPNSITALSNLQVMDLSDNNFSGDAFPSGFANLNGLKRLSIAKNSLSGSIPANIGNLTNLEIFEMSNNIIAGEIPASIGSLAKLKDLLLDNNKLTGKIPDAFSTLVNLKRVTINNNYLVGDLPQSLRRKYPITAIDASSNYLAGSNISSINSNQDNFVDWRNNLQNQMYIPPYYKMEVGNTVNVYDLFEVRDASKGTTKNKEKLTVNDYICTITNPPININELITFTTDATGFHIRVLKDIPYEEAIEFELKIKENVGSSYSKTNFRINTEKTTEKNDWTTGGNPPGGAPGPGGAMGRPAPAEEELLEETPEVPDEDFPELSSWDSDITEYVHDAYLFGYSDNTVKPNGFITREEATAIIYRIMDDEEKETFEKSESPLLDMVNDRWSYKAVTYLNHKGIVEGYTDGNFKPSKAITRAEFARIISDYIKLSDEGEDIFSDVDKHWASKHIRKVHKAGIMSGYPDGSFNPNQNITRAEVVSTINRILDRKPDIQLIENLDPTYVDLDKTHWAYVDIIEATITHKFRITKEGEEEWTSIKQV